MTIVHHCWSNAYRIADNSIPPFDGFRVLLVGEDNPQNTDPRYALWPVPKRGSPWCAGRNLQAKILALGHHHYYALWRTNLCLAPGAPTWNLNFANARARHLATGHHPWHTIVALGRKVTTSFERAIGHEIPTWSWIPHWTESGIQDSDSYFTIVSLPHPSGRARDWNDPANCMRAQELLREVEPDVPWGELGRIPVAEPQAAR